MTQRGTERALCSSSSSTRIDESTLKEPLATKPFFSLFSTQTTADGKERAREPFRFVSCFLSSTAPKNGRSATRKKTFQTFFGGGNGERSLLWFQNPERFLRPYLPDMMCLTFRRRLFFSFTKLAKLFRAWMSRSYVGQTKTLECSRQMDYTGLLTTYISKSSR